MRRNRRGFTIVEVSLFLAITGLLFMGVAVGVQNSVYQQRFNDSVQSFAEFMRSIYSQVSNVENPIEGGGQSDKSIYGKLVVFGEAKGLDGFSDNDGVVYAYTVIGDAGDGKGDDTLTELKDLDMNVVERKENNGVESIEFVGNVEEYKPKWMARIQGTGPDWSDFEGAVLVVRNPGSGTIFTYVSENTIQVNDIFNNDNAEGNMKDALSDASFDIGEIDFCVNPNGNSESDNRRDVSIIANARNASGVVVKNDRNNNCNEWN